MSLADVLGRGDHEDYPGLEQGSGHYKATMESKEETIFGKGGTYCAKFVQRAR